MEKDDLIKELKKVLHEDYPVLENDNQKEEQSEPSFDFNKMFINPSNSTENPLLEEINEIENSINNSNTLPPIEPETPKEQPAPEQPSKTEIQSEKTEDADKKTVA